METREHFTWQTEGQYVSERERELVTRAFLPLGKRILDLGCGHGATLVHLGSPEGAIGVDISPQEIAFATARVPRCRFLVADAASLPFEAGAFDHVLIRDVLHHVADPARVLAECARVLGQDGRLDVLEPSRNNPLILMHGLLDRTERGELRSTRPALERLVSAQFELLAVTAHQALPVHRVLLHPRYGWPGAAARPGVRRWLGRLEDAAERHLPAWVRAYLHLRARRRVRPG